MKKAMKRVQESARTATIEPEIAQHLVPHTDGGGLNCRGCNLLHYAGAPDYPTGCECGGLRHIITSMKVVAPDKDFPGEWTFVVFYTTACDSCGKVIEEQVTD